MEVEAVRIQDQRLPISRRTDDRAGLKDLAELGETAGQRLERQADVPPRTPRAHGAGGGFERGFVASVQANHQTREVKIQLLGLAGFVGCVFLPRGETKEIPLRMGLGSGLSHETAPSVRLKSMIRSLPGRSK